MINIINNNIMGTNFSEFTLNFKQACILCSIKRELILDDISYTEKRNRMLEVKEKKQWLKKWDLIIDSCLADLNTNFGFVSLKNIHFSDLLEKCNDEHETNQIWKYLILLECVIFEPYYPLDLPADDKNDLKSSNYSIYNDNKISYLKMIAPLMGMRETDVDTIKSKFESSVESLSKGWIDKFNYKSFINSIIPSTVVYPELYTSSLLMIVKKIYKAMTDRENYSIKDSNTIVEKMSLGGTLLLNCTEEDMIEIVSFSPQIVMFELAKIRTIVDNLVIGEYHDRILFNQVLVKLFKNELNLRTNLRIIKSTNCTEPEKLKNLQKGLVYLERGIEDIKNI